MRSTSERRSRGTGSRPAVEAPPPVVVTQAPVPPVVKPKAPDTLAVQIFKGDKQEQRKFVKPDTVKPPAP